MPLPEAKFLASLLIHIKGKRKHEVSALDTVTPAFPNLSSGCPGFRQVRLVSMASVRKNEEEYTPRGEGARVLFSVERGQIRRGRKFPPRIWPQVALEKMGMY